MGYQFTEAWGGSVAMAGMMRSPPSSKSTNRESTSFRSAFTAVRCISDMVIYLQALSVNRQDRHSTR